MATALSAYARYFDFTGRSTRGEFWGYVLLVLIGFAALLLVGVLATDDPAVAQLLLAAWLLFNVIPSLSAQVRRLHDTGRSGWWSLIGLVPLGQLVLLVFLCQRSVPVKRKTYAFEEPAADHFAVGRPTVPPPEQPHPGSVPLGELERLGSLRNQGILTDQEFDALKTRLMSGR